MNRELPSEITWRVDLMKVVSRAPVAATEVVLGERYQNRLLHGRVVYGPMAGTVVEIEQNDFPIRAEEAKSLLTQIFQSFRDEVGDADGITVYMDTEMWLAWLAIRFPGAALTIHTHLLAPTKHCP